MKHHIHLLCHQKDVSLDLYFVIQKLIQFLSLKIEFTGYKTI